MERFLYITFILLFCACNRQIDEGKEAYTELLGKEYKTLNFRCKKFFGDEIHAVIQEGENILLQWTSQAILPQANLFEGYILEKDQDKWQKFSTDLISLFPDYHVWPDKKIPRLVMYSFLTVHFNLEEDLKRWPDLIENFAEFPQRLALMLESPGLKYISSRQNEDGSWGKTDKNYWTSMALLSFLNQGEMNTSKIYGKYVKNAMLFLTENRLPTNSLENSIRMAVLASAYTMTGISILEEKIISSLPSFQKELLDSPKQKPELFLVQCFAISELYISGIENSIYESFSQNIKKLKPDSLEAISAKAMFNSSDLNESHLDKLFNWTMTHEVSPIRELLFTHALNRINNHPVAIPPDKLDDVFKGYLTYELPKTLQPDKFSFHNKFHSSVLNCQFNPWDRRFRIPTTRGNRIPKSIQTLQEEGLDLID